MKSSKKHYPMNPFDKQSSEIHILTLKGRPVPPTAEEIQLAWEAAIPKMEPKYVFGVDPYDIEVYDNPNLPDGVFFMLNENGLVERVTLEWDDKEKKNKVIVKKVK